MRSSTSSSPGQVEPPSKIFGAGASRPRRSKDEIHSFSSSSFASFRCATSNLKLPVTSTFPSGAPAATSRALSRSDCAKIRVNEPSTSPKNHLAALYRGALRSLTRALMRKSGIPIFFAIRMKFGQISLSVSTIARGLTVRKALFTKFGKSSGL